MKKTFIVLAVMAALMFSAAPSQALLGMPDDVPGKDILLPFLASMPGQGTVNTLLAVTDVYGAIPSFHYTVYTKRSETVFDENWKGTAFDIISTDALTIIGKMAPSEVKKLEIDLNGDGTKDCYAGYIYFEGNFGQATKNNSTVAQMMFVDMPRGVATAANAPVKEYAPTAVCPQMIDAKDMELFSASALLSGKSIQISPLCADAKGFAFFPRYYIINPGGKTYLFIWKSENAPAASLHVWFFNADEKYVSSTLPLPDELNIIDLEQYLPVGLHSNYPKEGWIQLLIPDTDGVGFAANREWVGYTWMTDPTNPMQSVDVLTPIHRDAW